MRGIVSFFGGVVGLRQRFSQVRKYDREGECQLGELIKIAFLWDFSCTYLYASSGLVTEVVAILADKGRTRIVHSLAVLVRCC